ncbi:MAG: DEAD/DEAH box helicase family protein [Planctomycetaceae bacterium]|nr:DEAD/DEAH box helicase family protein [Planctomycetaceae bacterium]
MTSSNKFNQSNRGEQFSFDFLAPMQKYNSPFAENNVSTPLLVGHVVNLEIQPMNRVTTASLFLEPDSETEHHAVPDDHSRIAGAVSKHQTLSREQQFLTLDYDDHGNRAAESTPASHRGDKAKGPDRFLPTDSQRGTGDRRVYGAGYFGATRETNPGKDLIAGRRSKKSYASPLLAFGDDQEQPPQTTETLPIIAANPTITPVAEPVSASGDKAKSYEILAAIRLAKSLSAANEPATEEHKQVLRKFGGFGPVALSLFPDPLTGKYKDASWQSLGEELKSLLTAEEYESAKRTTFNAFYTSPTVIGAMQSALSQLGISENALILEPGCGVGRFIGSHPNKARFIGVELDTVSGMIARLLHPQHDIRIENFRDTKLPVGKLDAVIGNVPFANIKLDYAGQRFSLHDFFFAKSLDALRDNGILALVTSHFTMDKQNAGIREYLASKADFLGAIRLPSDAFKQEGTKVVADIIFLKKRAKGQEPNHCDPDWLTTRETKIGDSLVPINQYFLNHPEQVLGTYSPENQLYGHSGYSILGTPDFTEKLAAATDRLPEFRTLPPLSSFEMQQNTNFTRPPPLRHLSEGSFFLGQDHQIYQVENGTNRPVMHGQTPLTGNGTMMGRRLAHLVQIRDAARLVLQSQNESWPEQERNSARHDLNRLYDLFVQAYGPINKTNLSENSDGTVIRRMPNLVKFRDDPDGMLVMSLEDYDEVTGNAEKTAIFRQDVVSRNQPIVEVSTAEEGLLVSLDQKGSVDIAYIAKLANLPESEVIAELSDLIFLNPQTQQWETADVYLSGNVKAKLEVARHAGEGFERNVSRLEAVLPPDILPGDIEARLGSPWIPASDVKAFAADLFQTSRENIHLAHLPKDAVWSVDTAGSVQDSVAAVSDYGTSRIDGVRLLELALNMKSPLIYDTIKTSDGEERVVNQEETLAAKEKQKLIKERFKQWIFNDPERTERLVRVYNDTYNNIRLRKFDGSHLEFPGMNQTITLRPHQKDAIWRGMSDGNCLLAHAVGAGKTFTMAATGMKLKQAGLVKKPMYVVPNHMLEQFSREFMQIFPNARLLIASKDDLGRDRRKYLTAKIASGDWDGIIVTHSSFERIGMSQQYQERFLREQISEYEAMLHDLSSSAEGKRHRNLLKTIEKQKANRENKLTELLAGDKKDDGLVFDELGVDHLFVDESHYFKNLETPTKMDRVAGVQTGGSQRAFDLFMKARYLDELHKGHGLTFASGTPISNTMVEMYNTQRFLDPHGLSERGIEHFDAWAANFGEVVDSMEISPDGSSLRTRSRFAKFNNIPELQQMFRAFADVQTAEMLDLPRPTLIGGKPATVSSPMSFKQSYIQQQLVDRYDRLRSQRIDPRVDNALAITTDGRKLALDARMLDPVADDVPDSKVNALVENVVRIWKDSTPTRGTQLIFSDMGVNPTGWGFSAYDDVIDKLVAAGIPKSQIATMGEADSDARKQVLFEQVRNGTVRVLLGSTQKMGTGTNVQKRLVALHHLDAPWKPAEVEQRDGRILRQGNENKEVAIYRYVTEGSFDAYMWQALETKARFIAQIMNGSSAVRQADDIGGQELSYAEVKAIASGNPAVLTLAETDAELQRLAILRKNHQDEQYLARKKLRELPSSIAWLEQRLEKLTQDQKTLAVHSAEDMTVGTHRVDEPHAVKLLSARLEQFVLHPDITKHYELGMYRGLSYGITVSPAGNKEVYLSGAINVSTPISRDAGGRAVHNALERLAQGYPEAIAKTRHELTVQQKQHHDYQQRLGLTFAHGDYLQQLQTLRDQLRTQLSQTHEDTTQPELPSVGELCDQIQALREAQQIAPTVERAIGNLQATSEEPITATIRQRLSHTKPDEAEINESSHSFEHRLVQSRENAELMLS